MPSPPLRNRSPEELNARPGTENRLPARLSRWGPKLPVSSSPLPAPRISRSAHHRHHQHRAPPLSLRSVAPSEAAGNSASGAADAWMPWSIVAARPPRRRGSRWGPQLADAGAAAAVPAQGAPPPAAPPSPGPPPPPAQEPADIIRRWSDEAAVATAAASPASGLGRSARYSGVHDMELDDSTLSTGTPLSAETPPAAGLAGPHADAAPLQADTDEARIQRLEREHEQLVQKLACDTAEQLRMQSTVDELRAELRAARDTASAELQARESALEMAEAAEVALEEGQWKLGASEAALSQERAAATELLSSAKAAAQLNETLSAAVTEYQTQLAQQEKRAEVQRSEMAAQQQLLADALSEAHQRLATQDEQLFATPAHHGTGATTESAADDEAPGLETPTASELPLFATPQPPPLGTWATPATQRRRVLPPHAEEASDEEDNNHDGHDLTPPSGSAAAPTNTGEAGELPRDAPPLLSFDSCSGRQGNRHSRRWLVGRGGRPDPICGGGG
jgi:hypothetical protein